MDGYDYLTSHAPLLQQFEGDPEKMFSFFGRASGGERVLISAAMSFLHPLDRPEGADEVLLELRDVGSLDQDNTRILLCAIEIEAGHGGMVR